MIHDLNNLNNQNNFDALYDVCIVGAGAAGITIANKLSESGLNIILCEAGSEEYTEASQKNYVGKVKGDPYFELDIARLRYLGGTTNHWNGMCRPFEKVDFNRDYLGKKFNWGIKYEEIQKYQREACEILEIKNNFFIDNEEKQDVKNINFQFSPPVRFKDKYFNILSSSKKISLLLNANLSDIKGETNYISNAIFENYGGKKISVKAKKFVFAMGGIENSRYLLWFSEKYKSKFFNSKTPIGKYWMEHPHFSLGSALVDKSIIDGIYFSIGEKFQRDLKILNCGFRINEVSHSDTKGMIKEILCIAPKLGMRLAALADKSLICGARLFAAWEQEPKITNAVKLTKDLSMFGIPLIELNWKKSSLDRQTIRQSVNLFNSWLLEKDLGRLQLFDWLIKNEEYPIYDELAGYHHMGGTRMSDTHEFGVVDKNCKVHGSKNLYIAGSSIFTTGGHNNPTLPIVQFALRLSEHLIEEINKIS